MGTIDIERLRQNWQGARDRIAAAAEGAGRDPADVEIVPATKYVGADECRALVEHCGATALGENRVQELESKADAMPGFDGWHFFGHLQRNKARKAVQHCACIQTLDSIRLADALERITVEERGEDGKFPVLIEVKTTGEEQKTGLTPQAVTDLLAHVRGACPHLDLQGFMTMAPYLDDSEGARPYFQMLRRIRDEHLPGGHLSMGMSGDFEVAIQEGATWVRLGSILFEGLRD